MEATLRRLPFFHRMQEQEGNRGNRQWGENTNSRHCRRTEEGKGWGEESWDGDETLFKTILTRGGCKSLLQVGKGLALVGKPGETGSIIDIDSFATETSGEFSSMLDKFLESAHQSEKELFFTLLKREFLESLNPVYEDAD